MQHAVQNNTPTPGVALYTATIFLSAALVFAVQPMLGKMLLPLVGGSPSGWLTALAFFQVTLLAGYLVAHLLSRLTARVQMAVTLGLLALGGLMLPPQVTAGAAEDVGNIGQVLLLLTQSIGIPYLALTTVSSGLQRLYAAQRGGQGGDPYFLYAASNAGSFIGLLTYPVLVEPFLPLSVQSQAWMWIYALLLGLIGALLLRPVRQDEAAVQRQPVEKAVISGRQRLNWVVLAFIPSSLSMGLTALITADMGSVPLFWVVPLGLYLLTFVIAFSAKRRLRPQDLMIAQNALVAIVLFVFIWSRGGFAMSWGFAGQLVAAFFVTALICHMKVADQRPAPAALTEFYLWLAFGGALGGVFNAFLAPILLAHPVEFMTLLFLSSLLHTMPKEKYKRVLGVFGMLVALGACAVLLHTPLEFGQKGMYLFVWLIMLIGICLVALVPRLLAAVGVVTVVLTILPWNVAYSLDTRRSFFGVIKVIDPPEENGQVWRHFMHGSTVHGAQLIKPTVDTRVTSYYVPLLDVLRLYNPHDVGVVGLGAGILLCATAPERRFTMYEIDPLVKDVAEEWFTFIKDCGQPDWRIGDGRLELLRDKDKRFDMLIVDAFSADSIPIHLLTREALGLYHQRVTDDAIILFNVSNRYYDVRPPLATLARDAGRQAWTLTDYEWNESTGKRPSQWVLLAPLGKDMEPLRQFRWRPLLDSGFPLWRDDFTNELLALRFFQ